MDGENILAAVGGEYVSRALKLLPGAETHKETECTTELEVPRFGLVVLISARSRRIAAVRLCANDLLYGSRAGRCLRHVSKVASA